MKILFFIIYFYLLDKIWLYYQIKHDCKKYNANCDNCSNFLCPRFRILHKEEDKIFINKIKSTLKSKFNINKKLGGFLVTPSESLKFETILKIWGEF